MSKAKKVLLMCTAYVLVAALAIGGTIAYLTSKDSDVNVMTMGNVEIEQIEQQYDENGNLAPFVQDKPLYPYVGELGWKNTDKDNGAYRQFTMNNVVDKYVSVKNTGKSDAYVRTFIALEMGDYSYEEFTMIGLSNNAINGAEFEFDGAWEWTDDFVAEIDGHNYNIMVAVHKDAVTPGETTIPSLLQVYLSKDATNETVEKLDGNDNGTYDILVFSEAVQTNGFADAKTALNTAFGDTAEPTRYNPWGDAPIHFPGYVYNQNELEDALKTGGKIKLGASFTLDDTVDVEKDTQIFGNGFAISRAGTMARTASFSGNMFTVKEGQTLELTNIVLDGGAIWTGDKDVNLQRGTVNSGVTATGNLILASENSHIILGEGAVLQNNDGANAVNLGTRVGAKLTLNGGEIINNSSAAGAIWGGGNIIVNSGKINGNYGGIGGAIRIVTNIPGAVLTMNGGEMNHNVSGGVGGAIWAGSSKSSNTYILNGGEMAYNYSPVAGGALYAGYYETVKIGGDFKMHHNSAPAAGAIRFHDHASFVMTGGEIYENGDNSLFLLNNSATITGGKISDTFSYGGGLGFVWGEGEIESVAFDLSTNHNTAYLKESFNTIKFTVNEADEDFSNFNFKPADGYVYAEGDENKLICLNNGYTVKWDATTATFRLTAE